MKSVTKAMFVLLFSVSAAFAFAPADYADKDTIFYAEIDSYSSLLKKTQTFYLNLRNPAGKNELEMVKTQFKQNMGIDILDEKAVAAFGVDVTQPIAVGVTMADPQMQKGKVHVWIPSSNSAKLYQNVLKMLAAKDAEAKQYDEGAQASFTELKSGELIEIRQGEVFIARGSDFIYVTTDQATANNPSKAGDSLAGTEKYKLLKNHYAKSVKTGIYLMDYSLVTTAALSQYAHVNGEAGNKIEQQYLEEIKENLISIGGKLDIRPKSFNIQFTYFYKEGYLQDMTKMMPKLLKNTSNPTAIDFFNGNPIAYFSLKMNLPEFYNVMKGMQPTIASSVAEMNQGFSADTGLDIETDVINSFTGRGSMLLVSIPPEKKLQDFNAWNGAMAVGITPGSGEKFNKIIMALQKKNEDPNLTIKSKKMGNNVTLWTFVTKMNPESEATEEAAPAKPAKTNTVFVYVKSDEIVIAPKTNSWITKPAGKVHLIKKLVNGNESNTPGIFYVDIISVSKYMKTTSYGMMMGMYLAYIQNVKDVYMISSTEKDITTSDFMIRLK